VVRDLHIKRFLLTLLITRAVLEGKEVVSPDGVREKIGYIVPGQAFKALQDPTIFNPTEPVCSCHEYLQLDFGIRRLSLQVSESR